MKAAEPQIETDLLKEYSDNANLVLGRTLETEKGRAFCSLVERCVNDSLKNVETVLVLLEPHDIFYNMPQNERRILMNAMIERAASRWVREQLR
jgi:hypothetical protein